MSWRAGGIRPWIVQRLSAVYMASVLFMFTGIVMFNGPENFAAWHQWMTEPFWSLVFIVFWVSLFAHAWVGIRDVVMDYIHPDGWRFILLASFGFYLIAMMVWMFKIMIMAAN